jgi:uncharacterized membrane protein YdjX (TVP38/TMEM64 family)
MGLFRLLTRLDARGWRQLALAFVLFGGVGLVFLFGAAALGLDEGKSLEAWMGAGVTGPWALPAAVAGFASLAFLGVPQFVLIAAAVVAFGPWMGLAYSWIGTLISALIGFFLGRRFGSRLLDQLASDGVRRFVAMVARNGFLASLVVRLVPSAPFIVVNVAAGVTGMGVVPFAFGTALGIVPKIALTAFAGAAVVKAATGGGGHGWLLLVGVAALWIGAGLLAKRWSRRPEPDQAPALPPEPPGRT